MSECLRMNHGSAYGICMATRLIDILYDINQSFADAGKFTFYVSQGQRGNNVTYHPFRG